MTLYRNAASRTYHVAAPDWIRSGRALCGRDISRPAFTARVDHLPFGRAVCADCTRRAEKGSQS